MKKQIQIISAFLFMMAMVSISCRKQSFPVPNPVPANGITKIYKNGDVQEVRYNADSTIHSVTLKQSGGGMVTNYLYRYTNGKLTEIDFGGKWKYYYSGDLISSVETINNTGDIRYRFEFAYTNNLLTEKKEYLVNNASVKPYTKTVYTYTQEGNISKTERFDYINNDWRRAETYEIIEYDHHPNTSLHLENYPFLPLSCFSKNNPVKELFINDIGQQTGTVTHQYGYDNEGRPGARKTTYSNIGFPDASVITSFEY
jgi:hypothetical protein